MKFVSALFAAAALCAVAAPASAREPSVWVQCDGLPKPEGAGKTLARFGAVVMSGGLFGLPEGQRETPAASGKPGVAACTTALADPVLNGLWARKASLLRSRAMHHAEADDLPAALADLQAIAPVTAGQVEERYFARSAGVSIQLFEAAVLARQGRVAEAEALAIKAAEARPWSNQVQTLAAAILAVDPSWTPAEDRVLTRRAALDPSALVSRAAAREWGDPAGAAGDWALAADQMTAALKAWPGPNLLGRGEDPMIDTLALQPTAVARAALSAARAGREAEARSRLAQLQTLQPWTPAKPAKGRQAETLGRISAASGALIGKVRDSYTPVVEAFLLVNAGRTAEASALIRDKRMPLEPAVVELLGKLKTGTAPDGLDKLPEELRATRLKALDVVDYAKALPLLEARPKRSPFTSQGPLLFRSPNGFADRENKVTGGRTIEFAGDLSQPVVEELLLLRAAQLTREAKASGFRFTAKDDFKRYHVTTMYGAETSRTPSGFQSRAEMVFASPTAGAGLVLDPEQVWAELSPFYVYE